MNPSVNRTSKLFWPVVVTPKDAVKKTIETISRSQRLMYELGLIKSSNNGTFQILPIAQRALDKCVSLIDKHMKSVDAQKISLPILTASALWKKTGRLNEGIDEFYLLNDRQGKEYILSPTHEESITAMLAAIAPISYKQLPLRLYQIGPKFRDELKARFGLMRSKEFIMKDMYSFDETVEEGQRSYERINEAYTSFFDRLQVPYLKVAASPGMMGGSNSHEYHFLSSAGEDKIHRCLYCNYAKNKEVSTDEENCSTCGNPLDTLKGIEIGHTFLLNDKYSKPLGATFLKSTGKPDFLYMGCYGIGVSRLLAASLEVLSTDLELKWPHLIAPYLICIITPKDGSKEETKGARMENELFSSLIEICSSDDIILDDRKHLTIGKRLMDSKRMGYPVIIVVGSKVLGNDPKLELHINGVKNLLELNEVISEVGEYLDVKNRLLN